MRFEELVYFVAFIEIEPDSIQKEELIYELIKEKLGYTRDSYETARDKYHSSFSSLSQTDILEIKRASRDFDSQKKEAQDEYERGTITYNEKARRLLICYKRFEEKINKILGEPLIDEKKLDVFSFSSVFKILLSKFSSK